ncbi:MAG: V-type ATP synthase subunit A, partial [Synergistales bacterium]|nr:V-type ATP synthase subunit A [Synergistales bacterium]
MIKTGKISAISGPVVRAVMDSSARMFEVALVGDSELLGEVIRIDGKFAFIQVYENTNGIQIGEKVQFTGKLLSVELGPGMLGQVLDGIGRPLGKLSKDDFFIKRGVRTRTLQDDIKWHFVPLKRSGDIIFPGTIFGYVEEGSYFRHSISLPPYIKESTISWIAEEGDYLVDHILCSLEDGSDLSMVQNWEVRTPRPVARRFPLNEPLVTGQRILDTLFPLALGGAAVLPGGFGTGKTVTQQSLAKWCNADVIVYIGCGERGNEMTEVLEEFPELFDQLHNAPLMERMVLIANTSNMPVAAREASIYLGMTIAEYFRDMGLHVAMMADSTSRWAEALREIGGRLEEMPGEEGYPAYLGTRLAQYYERSGKVKALGEPDRQGSITIINAVSPPGGDFSEPVTQTSLRLSGTFWGLDKGLAQQRHFPAINWNSSYSLYSSSLAGYFCERLGSNWEEIIHSLKKTLEREKSLKDLVQLVGRDGLSEEDKWTLDFSELVRVIYLQQ